MILLRLVNDQVEIFSQVSDAALRFQVVQVVVSFGWSDVRSIQMCSEVLRWDEVGVCFCCCSCETGVVREDESI